MAQALLVALAAGSAAVATAVTPGQVPKYLMTWNMSRSTAIMICNNSGPVDAQWAAPWGERSRVPAARLAGAPGAPACPPSPAPPPLLRAGLVDVDWNSDKVDWSKVSPMNNEENMLANLVAIRQANPNAITWLYRNGIKALPWFTSVRTKLEDPAYWGW